MATVKAGKRSGKGCFFWGTLTLLAVIIVSVAGILLAGWLQVRSFVGALGDAPAPLPAVQATPEVVSRAESKYALLREAIANGSETSVAFTDRELNLLIAQHPDFAALKRHLFVTIDEDVMEVQVTYPAEPLNPQLMGLFDVSGKHFNGSFRLQPEMREGRLRFRVQTASMDGEPVSNATLRLLQQNDLREIMEQALSADQLNELRQIEAALATFTTRDGQLRIRTQAGESAEEAP